MKFEDLTEEEKRKMVRTYYASLCAFYDPKDPWIHKLLNDEPLFTECKIKFENWDKQ